MTTELDFASARPARSIRLARTAAAALGLLVAAGCTTPAAPSATPTGTGSPGTPTAAPPTASPVAGAVNHPTGATDVVLRMETGAGMILEANMVAAPSFTLYGDGMVIFRDPTAVPPEPIGGVRREVPFSAVRLGAEGMQALLKEALGPGGLAIATGPDPGMTADIPTTTFSITADGQTKQVSITGLSPDLHPQDAVVAAALGRLAEQLDGFGADIAGEVAFAPAAYRGVLLPVEQPFGPVVPWPWPDIEPDDFVGGANNLFKVRTLTEADVAAIGIDGVGGGFSGLNLQSEGKVYAFALRPLLPDETE